MPSGASGAVARLTSMDATARGTRRDHALERMA